jgi:hypothetical protein
LIPPGAWQGVIHGVIGNGNALHARKCKVVLPMANGFIFAVDFSRLFGTPWRMETPSIRVLFNQMQYVSCPRILTVFSRYCFARNSCIGRFARSVSECHVCGSAPPLAKPPSGHLSAFLLGQ